jgi:NAD(P)-dependent dehydrogenase (short-subunit alcohol dehydrogenase family)
MDKNELSEEAAYAADLMRTADKARDRPPALRHDADDRIRSTADILRPVAHFLAADASSYITGQVWSVNAGLDMRPSRPDPHE